MVVERRRQNFTGVRKKVKAGQLRLVLLKGIGSSVVTADYPQSALRNTLDELFRA